MNEATGAAGKGCAYLLLLALLLGALVMLPAVLGVGELADAHRAEQRVID